LAKYEKLEEEAKEKSRKAHKTAAQTFDQNFFNDFTRTHKPCAFDGYRNGALEAHIWGIVVDGRFTDEIKEGQEGLLILDKTPFYAEMGGQVGDTGSIGNFQVYDCTAPFPGVIAHLGKMGAGVLRKGQTAHAAIDTVRRREIQNNHTATHLLHWALQKVLGSHVKQAGSLVDEKRLRFDFSHHKPMSGEELREIENLVNEKVRSDSPVRSYEISYDEAQKRSDIKQFFGEKYGEKVRVIDIDFSKELCGGTHTSHVGTIGYFKIAKESSIAAGVRRIEALTGRYAEMLVQQEEDLLQGLAAQLKTSVQGIPEKMQALLDENKLLAQELKSYRKGQLKQLLDRCLAHKEHVGAISLIAVEVALSADELNEFAGELIAQMKSGVVALGLSQGERCQLLVAVSPDLVQKNIHAQALIKEVAPLIQGGGGGKQNLAQAGGKDPQGLPKALDKIRHILKDVHLTR
jgi:alanyl-tRNA synthetase